MIQYTFIIPTITISNIFIKALDNLVNQNFEHKYEIIVIIDNINLPIAEGIKNLYPNEVRNKLIRIIQNNQNYGLTKSLNIAVSKSKGKFIVRNDEDDISSLDRLSCLNNIIKNNKNIKIISSDYLLQNKKIKFIKKQNLDQNLLKRILKIKNPLAHSSVCFEKNLFQKLGCYNESLKVSQDYDLWSKFIYSQKNIYHHINKPLVTINLGKNSISRKYSNTQKINSVLISLKNNFYDILSYNNYENKNLIINNILNLEDNYFIEIKNKLLALMYCYLTKKKINYKFKLNFKFLLNVITIYYYYPNLLLKKLLKRL